MTRAFVLSLSLATAALAGQTRPCPIATSDGGSPVSLRAPQSSNANTDSPRGPQVELQQLTQPTSGSVWNYDYDALNRLSAVTPPGGSLKRQTWAYDGIGRVTTHMDGPRAWHTSYTNGVATLTSSSNDAIARLIDSRGRLLSETLPTVVGSQSIASVSSHVFTYDGLDAMRTMQEGNRPASVFEYPDDSHRLSKVTRGTDVVSFDYDGNSTRVSAVKKGSGVPPDATVSRFYTSPTKRLSSITGAWGTTDVAWERGGARLLSLNGGLANETFCFDGPGRIQSIDTGGGNCLSPSSSARVYSYDGRGNPTTEAYGGVTRHFGYDAADRLTSSTDWSGVSTGLSLHPDGTRNTELVGGELHTYDYDTNTGALSAVRNGSTTLAAWSYLNDGRVSSRTIGSSTSTYAWDGFGRLVSATSSAGTSTFEYDALGLRRASSLNGVPTSSFTWVGESQVAEGEELVSSVGPFLLSQGNVRFTHDALGSIVGQSKLQPAPLLPLTSSAAYGTWGAQSGGTQLTSNSHAGQRLDDALGLVENQQRWRDPIFGVWLSRDSVGASSYLSTPNGLGPWSYANLNPLRYVDPDGRRGCFPGEEHTTCEARLIATGGIEGSAFRPSVPTTFVHPLEAQSQRAMAKVEQTKRHMFVAAGVGLTLAGGAGIALLAAEGGLSFGGFMALSMSTEAASGRHQADRNGPGRR